MLPPLLAKSIAAIYWSSGSLSPHIHFRHGHLHANHICIATCCDSSSSLDPRSWPPPSLIDLELVHERLRSLFFPDVPASPHHNHYRRRRNAWGLLLDANQETNHNVEARKIAFPTPHVGVGDNHLGCVAHCTQPTNHISYDDATTCRWLVRKGDRCNVIGGTLAWWTVGNIRTPWTRDRLVKVWPKHTS
jgi:hypothetical protein